MTITDPRHPLCGRVLPLVGIANKPYLGRCCVVWIARDVERYVPVSATDLEFDPALIYPTPLSVAGLEELMRVFEKIKRSYQEESNHATSSLGSPRPRPANPSASTMDFFEPRPTKADSPETRLDSSAITGTVEDKPLLED